MTTPTSNLVALLAEVHDDPAAFWRLVLRGEPRAWQAAVCEEIRRKLAAGERHLRIHARTCHGGGKSVLGSALGLWWTATRPGSRGLSLGPTWTTIESVVWVETAKLYRGSLLAAAGVGNLLQTSITFGDGWDFCGLNSDVAANLEGRHGAAAFRLADEAKSIPAAVFESTAALLDAVETCDMMVSTPSIPSGPFYELDVKGGPDVIRIHVTIDDLIAEGLPGKAEWKASRLAEWGANSPEFESRCMARYVSDAEGALFPFSWVSRAESAGFEVNLPPTAGLDVAGSVAGDASALSIISGPDDQGRYQVRSVTSWHEKESTATQGRALHLAREAGAKVLAVDTVGVGYGVHGAMKSEKGISIVSFKASSAANEPDRFTNRKSETAWALRLLLEAGKIALPKHDGLRRELLGMRYQITSQGKIKTVDPSDSPDLVDAVLIALAGPKRIRGQGILDYWAEMDAEASGHPVGGRDAYSYRPGEVRDPRDDGSRMFMPGTSGPPEGVPPPPPAPAFVPTPGQDPKVWHNLGPGCCEFGPPPGVPTDRTGGHMVI